VVTASEGRSRNALASSIVSPASARVPLRVVQEVFGHSQLSTTADVHAHVAPELQREAAERMGVLLANLEQMS
jgi:integrase